MNLFLIEQFLVSDIINLFRPSTKLTVDPKAARAQKEAAEKLKLSEAREKREKRSRDQVVASNQGRRGRGTLFAQTGEVGVPKAKLGA